MEKPVKVGLYTRVSKKDQTCESQLHDLRRYAEARGWTIEQEYIDHDVSGGKASRAALDRAMSDARARRIDAILVTKLDRWARSMPHLVSSVQELDSLGVRWVAIDQGLDTDRKNPQSRLLLNVMGAFAEFERSLISERTLAGLAHARRQGRIGGNRPLCVDRQKIRDARAAGQSFRDIAKQFNISKSSVVNYCRV